MRVYHPRHTRSILPAAVGLLVAAACLLSPVRAAAQSAAGTLYTQAQAAEQAARADASPAPETLRKVARSYEAIVLRFPTSGYTDNALWQAAGLYATAYQISNDAADRAQAERMLQWLKKEYPASSFVKRVDGAIQALGQPAAPPPTAPAASDPPKAAAPDAPNGSSPAVIRSITETALPHGERITIEFTHEVAYSGDRVDNPDRVFFDFVNANAAASLPDHLPTPSGALLKAVRVGRHAPDVTRVVLELAGNPRYSAFPVYGPFRFVIDVESTDAAPSGAPSAPPAPTPAVPTPAAATTEPKSTPAPTPSGASKTEPKVTPAPTPTPVPTTTVEPPAALKTSNGSAAGSPLPPSSNRSGDYSLSRQLGLGVSRIVIDAGHGGHDPGAQANGIDEAELTLDVAQRLQKLLDGQPGFDVVLTRSTDQYVALEERTAIANREGADLFLSIHANASRQSAASGVETYFLNFATNPTAEAVAARENAASGQTMGTLPDILKAIALNNKLAESRELAAIVQTSLVRRLSMQNKAVRDLGVKQAPFVVLIGAQMPSVLAEISFLTNRGDAALLKQASYRQRIAQALCDAVMKYQASLKKVTTVASRDGGR
jgi:N-acetylmuramoyl-L-alanine amidase